MPVDKHHLNPKANGGNDGRSNRLRIITRHHDLWHGLFGQMPIWAINAFVSELVRTGTSPRIQWTRQVRNVHEYLDCWFILFKGLNLTQAHLIIEGIARGRIKSFMRLSATYPCSRNSKKKARAAIEMIARKKRRRNKVTK
jgi:hypothetical protein